MTVRNSVYPVVFDATVRATHRFRYTCATAGSFTISRGTLLNAIMFAMSTTTLGRVISAIRINRITIYGLTTSNGSNPNPISTVSLEWLSDLGTTTIKSDTGNSFEPAYVISGPPSNSRASFWSRTAVNESESLFRLSLALGNIVDFEVSIVFMNDDTPATVSTTGLTAGNMYQPSIGVFLNAVSYPVA